MRLIFSLIRTLLFLEVVASATLLHQESGCIVLSILTIAVVKSAVFFGCLTSLK